MAAVLEAPLLLYRTHNGRYHGRAYPKNLVVARDGRVVNERALSKIRRAERRNDYACAELGAPRRTPNEEGSAYLERALTDGGFRRVRRPGNHVFSWGW